MNPKQQADVRLAQAVVSLQASNGTAWAAFMTALAERIDYLTEGFVSAPAPDLQRLQGHALEARALFTQLEGARKLVEDMQAKERTNGTAPRQP